VGERIRCRRGGVDEFLTPPRGRGYSLRRFLKELIVREGHSRVWGLFKKMAVADRLALFVDSVFSNPQAGGLSLVFGAYFFAFQI